MSQLAALGLTVLVECVVLALLWGLAKPLRARGPLHEWLLIGAAASLITHPVMWWCWSMVPGTFWFRFVLWESLVVSAEATLYRSVFALRWPQALGASALLNACSAGVGLLIQS